MKTRYFSMAIVFSMFLLAGCTSDGPAPTKSASLGIKFSSSALVAAGANSGRMSATDFLLTGFSVSVADVVIEENSGNDGESDGNNNDGRKAKKEDKNEGAEAEDIVLPGPFLLDLASGSASIEQVAVYPGTFKKIDFTFSPSSSADFGGSSIVIAGDYTMADGSVVSVLLQSDFDQQIQLPLANGGVTVANNSSVDLSVTLDANGLLSTVDLASAMIVGGTITINKANNADLLAQFETVLSQYIDVED
ncbi:MAG: hypothetical protein RIE86_11825 [Imperialibacter sp.]|uniref:DUF4382 domain-containing protein n=1 Tax=Imperialibacter roseus TaxID=1324217 RepID=A0ABZ0IQB0_9BACT|nr:hypothetical protein [Imperialibacter roseus]WOK07228.1 hypothetical protein RT717_01155 [Imperialibacter roseus]